MLCAEQLGDILEARKTELRQTQQRELDKMNDEHLKRMRALQDEYSDKVCDFLRVQCALSFYCALDIYSVQIWRS